MSGKQDAFADLFVLSRASKAAAPAAASTTTSATAPPFQPGVWDMDLLIPTSKPTPKPTPETPTVDALDDLFAVFNQPLKPSTPPIEKIPVFEERPVEVTTSSPATPQPNHTPPSTVSDALLSDLLEMGFTFQQASEAVEVAGSDRNLAVSFLMTQAHQPAAASSTSAADLATVAALRASELASSWLNLGRKHLVKGIEKYKELQRMALPAQPAWMKGLHQMDPVEAEEVERIVREQREKERRRTQERIAEMRPRPTRSPIPVLQSERSESSRESLASARSSPVPILPKARDVPLGGLIDLASSLRLLKAEDILPVSASRHRSRPSPAAGMGSTLSVMPELKLDSLSLSETPSPAPVRVNRSAPVVTRAHQPLSSMLAFEYTRLKTEGNGAFAAGDFPLALSLYESALAQLPARHDYSITAYSNLAAAALKLGDLRKAIDYADAGVAIIGSAVAGNVNGEDKPVKELWVKLLTRKAEALEGMEKWTDAVKTYTLVIEGGGAAKAVIEGRRRCQKAKAAVDLPVPVKPVFKPAVAKPAAVRPNRASTSAASRVQKQALAQADLDAARFALHDTVTARIAAWKSDNLRALLASLPAVLPPSSGWKPVTMTDLVLPKKVKLCYMKAVAKTHPDKVSMEVLMEDRMVMEGVFVALNEAWEVFKEENGL